MRYRQAFRTGQIEFNGALSFDDLLPGKRRGYVLGTGAFDLPRDFDLTFQIETVSDHAYLLDYGISEDDRLDSRIEVTRTRRNEYISGRIINFRSIRAGESNATLPSLVGDLTFHRRFTPELIGGEGGLRFQTHSHYRNSNSSARCRRRRHCRWPRSGPSVSRLDWRRNWILPGGMVASLLGEGSADIYRINQDTVYHGTTTRFDGGLRL